MWERLRREYFCRVRVVLRTELYGWHRILAINGFQCFSQDLLPTVNMTSLNIMTLINDIIKCLMLTYLVMTS